MDSFDNFTTIKKEKIPDCSAIIKIAYAGFLALD